MDTQNQFMHRYTLNRTPKTKILNILRHPFRIGFFEKLISIQTIKNPYSFWSKLVPPNYLYPHGSIRTVFRDGVIFQLDLSDVVDHYIFFGFKDSNYDSVSEKIQNAKVIFDIGANIGSTSLRFSTINKSATIFSFEPHPKTFQRAIENLNLNPEKSKNIKLNRIGLGDKIETLKLYEVNSRNPGMNRIAADNLQFPYHEIQMSTLDHFVSENEIDHVDFIKIDVEGFEYAVLNGAINCLNRCKPTLFIELDDDNLLENQTSAKELISLLKSYGYQVFKRADNLDLINEDFHFKHCHFDMIAN